MDKVKDIKDKLESYRRVLILAKKPTIREFNRTARICAVGMTIIGLFGFIFYLISVLVGA